MNTTVSAAIIGRVHTLSIGHFHAFDSFLAVPRVVLLLVLLLVALFGCAPQAVQFCPFGLPVYDHVVIVIEENKDYEQIIGNPAAPYLNRLTAEGALLTRMFGEEHNSQGNYFWLFSGDNQGVGFDDKIPPVKFTANNLGAALIAKGQSFKGYSEGLPAIGSEVPVTPPGCRYPCRYGRKHVPWISFVNVPNGTAVETSSNLRFVDFPMDYNDLPTVAFVIPDQENDMHNGAPQETIPAGDRWLAQNLDRYYQWAKTHNSLLIVTFDENDNYTANLHGFTDPATPQDGSARARAAQNRIPTIIAGAHIKPGFNEPMMVNHVTLLRTLEAIYGLSRSGHQQPNAAGAGIGDDIILTDVFQPAAAG